MTRKMTVSELIHHLWMYRACEEFAVAESLVGVTIVPDPEPRPNFDGMTTWDVVEWCFEHQRNRCHCERYANIKKLVSRLANDIADAKGMD